MIVKSGLNLEEGDIQSLQPPARLKTSNAVWCDPLFFSLEGDFSVSVRVGALPRNLCRGTDFV